jgi:hypothetical protein
MASHTRVRQDKLPAIHHVHRPHRDSHVPVGPTERPAATTCPRYQPTSSELATNPTSEPLPRHSSHSPVALANQLEIGDTNPTDEPPAPVRDPCDQPPVGRGAVGNPGSTVQLAADRWLLRLGRVLGRQQLGAANLRLASPNRWPDAPGLGAGRTRPGVSAVGG